MKRQYPFRGDIRSPMKTKEYYVNPVNFWKYVFKCKISSRIIKILCVLLGTDYNPYDKTSPIHMKCFTDILPRLNIKSFSDIDEDALLVHIYNIMSQNPTNKHVIATATALNIYLADSIEGKLHDLISELRTFKPCVTSVSAKRSRRGDTVKVDGKVLNKRKHIRFDRLGGQLGGVLGGSMDDTTSNAISSNSTQNNQIYDENLISSILQFDNVVRGMIWWN